VLTLLSDLSDEGRLDLDAFAAWHRLEPAHRAAVVAVYAAVKVFMKALRRGGRDVTTGESLASPEHLYGFPTGVTPAITYAPAPRRRHRFGAPHIRAGQPVDYAVAPQSHLRRRRIVDTDVEIFVIEAVCVEIDKTTTLS